MGGFGNVRYARPVGQGDGIGLTSARKTDKMFSMKKTGCLLLLLLGACSSPIDSRTSAILSMAGPNSMSLLKGKTTQEVEQMVGLPTFVRTEEPYQSWIFKAPDCALFVFFDEQGVSSYAESKGSCDKQAALEVLSQKTYRF